MADEKDPKNPLKQSADTSEQLLKSSVKYREVLKDIIQEQEDISGILRDVLKDLTKSQDQYSKIEAKIERIRKGTLDVNGLQKEANRLEEAKIISEKKLQEIQILAGEKAKEKLSYMKREAEAVTARLIAAGKHATVEDAMLDFLKYEEDHQLTQLYLSEKNLELAQKRLGAAKEEVDYEKQVAKNIGVTGFLAKEFADKLGIGNEFFDRLVKKTKEQNKELTLAQKATLLWNTATESVSNYFKKLRDDPAVAAAMIVGGFNKMGNAAKAAANGVGDFMKMSGDQVIGKLTGSISGLVSKIPIVGGLLGGLVEGFGKLLELSLAEDDKVVKIGRDLGVSKDQATAINDRFLKMAVNSKSISVNSANLLQSQKDLSAQLGVNNILSEQILKTDTELSKMMGLDAKTRASIAESSILTGKSSESITKSVFGQVGALKAATGISFDYKKVLAEASNFSGVLGLQFAKYPDKLAKSLVSIKSMGLEMNKLDSMADKFLSFESSISQEFEAQLLTGKQLNLSKAREAFLNNDLATAAKEITRQVGNSSEFMKMNRIQQESLASAMGMSRDEMADMLKKQEMLSKLGAKDLKEAQAKVEALKAQGKSRAEITKMVGEEAYNNLTNASAQEKIAGFMEKIQGAVANFLSKSPIMDIIDRAMNFLNEPGSINKIVTQIQGFFAGLFDVMGGIAGSLMQVANVFGADIDESLIRKVKKGGSFVRGMNLTGGAGVGENAAKEKIAGEASAGGAAQRQIRSAGEGSTTLIIKSEVVDTPQNMSGRVSRGVAIDTTKMN